MVAALQNEPNLGQWDQELNFRSLGMTSLAISGFWVCWD